MDRLHRFYTNWVYGGSLAGVLLLALTPLLSRGWPSALLATFLCLPLSMLHQYEEHDADRFRLYFNSTLGKRRELLSPAAVFVINVPGVWGVLALSFWLAYVGSLGWGLIAAYLVLVNALAHIAVSVIKRAYNPGLGTAVCLSTPVSIYAIDAISRSGEGTHTFHLLGLGMALALHAGILLYAKRSQSLTLVEPNVRRAPRS